MIPVNLLVNIQTQNWSLSLSPGFPFLILLYWFLLLCPTWNLKVLLSSLYCFSGDLIWSLNIKYHLYADNFQIVISSPISTPKSRHWYPKAFLKFHLGSCRYGQYGTHDSFFTNLLPPSVFSISWWVYRTCYYQRQKSGSHLWLFLSLIPYSIIKFY